MDKFKEEAEQIIDSRISGLGGKSFEEASALPESASEDCIVAGENASVTVFRQISPYQLEDKVLITVLVAKPVVFALASTHIERGLVFSPIEAVREATQDELQNTGG